MRCEPATSLIDKLGGPGAVAEALKLHVSAVVRWRLNKPVGTGGLIPSKHQPALMQLGAKPEDFFAQPAREVA